MNLTALTLMGLVAGVGQPTGDVVPMKTRSITLAIDYDPARRKDIDKVVLFYSRGDAVWHLAKSVLPNEDSFKFDAPEDGVYWFNLMNVYRDGRKDPPDISAVPPAAKFLLDATPPVVRITHARREGDEVLVQWEIDEKFPDDKALRVTYRTDGIIEDGWQPVAPEHLGRRSARFRVGTAGPITVQVTASDLAGHQGSATRDLPGSASAPSLATAVSPAGGTAIPPPSLNFNTESSPAAGSGVAGPVAPAAPIPPPSLPVEAMPPPTMPAPVPTAPTAAMTPAPALSPGPVTAPTPAYAPAAASQPPTIPPAATDATPTFTGSPHWSPAGSPASGDRTTPIAFSNGPPPTPDSIGGVQVLRTARFDLQYQVENGPSGLSRIDLYVTRDDGRSWIPWSQHSGQESPLRVVLDTPYNRDVEGYYGFRLVPVSGTGLAEGAPTPGTPPEMRVLIDLTPPTILVYQPTADPANRNVLILRWKAEDRNFGREPIAIEWSEHAHGPWLPVTGGSGVSQVVAGPGLGSNRIANTGSFPWAIPAGLGTHKVYLRFTAWDAAGNQSEAITPHPVVVDLTKPRAKIQGIASGFPMRP